MTESTPESKGRNTRQRRAVSAILADLDGFAGKVGRKLDNTLGLFISMNGFQDSAVETHSRQRPVMVLMTGSDLFAVLEGRFDLPELLTRKRQHAARTGEVLVDVATLLG